jgi:SAM-dependent methyltransferase
VRLPAGRDPEVGKALEDVGALYTGNLAEHGIDSRAVGWPDAESHRLRFEKLAYVLEAAPPEGGYSAADWGCGYGAMFQFLDAHPAGRLESWTGYDISEEMLAAARDHVGDERARFVHGDEVTEDADYVFVSGTFNVRAESSEEAWGEFVREKVAELYERSRRGLAFNLLTTYVDWRKDDLFYAHPAEFFSFCRRELSRYVSLLHDYPLYEWTMVVTREAPRE